MPIQGLKWSPPSRAGVYRRRPEGRRRRIEEHSVVRWKPLFPRGIIQSVQPRPQHRGEPMIRGKISEPAF